MKLHRLQAKLDGYQTSNHAQVEGAVTLPETPEAASYRCSLLPHGSKAASLPSYHEPSRLSSCLCISRRQQRSKCHGSNDLTDLTCVMAQLGLACQGLSAFLPCCKTHTCNNPT